MRTAVAVTLALTVLLVTPALARPDTPDHGPLYRESDFGRLPVEPWATVTNLAFLAIVIYWLGKTRGDRLRHAFITASMPILFVGWVGGTLFHATRSHVAWLMLDVLPIIMLTMMAAALFWRKLRVPMLAIIGIFLIPIFGVHLGGEALGMLDATRINIGYAAMALGILVPIVVYALRHRHPEAWLIPASLGAFIAAVTCRAMDLNEAIPLPMGTHFLWHLLGALASHLLILYIYCDTNRTAAKRRSLLRPDEISPG